MNKLIVILGPTASGKTALSIKLAKKYNGEIVSADSRQVYRGMDIGTAKPLDIEGVPHCIINIKNPDQPYTVAEFKNRSDKGPVSPLYCDLKRKIIIQQSAIIAKAVQMRY